MLRFYPIFTMIFMGIFCSLPLDCTAFEIESRYTTITYSNNRDLRKFNKKLYLGRLQSQIRGSGNTIESEVVAKIDFIVEKVRAVLDMFPPKLKFSIVIHSNEREVQQDFRKLYKIDVGYIAFYSPSANKVFYSANNAVLRVVAHEIGHVVAENYFTVSPPQRIHEVLAQFAEAHVTD